MIQKVSLTRTTRLFDFTKSKVSVKFKAFPMLPSQMK